MKPRVHIKDWAVLDQFKPARLYGWPTDHPNTNPAGHVSNTKAVITSPIVNEFVAGPEHQHFIETENTLYILMGQGNRPPPVCDDCTATELPPEWEVRR